MTFDRDRHETFEELISASLHGDLTADEQRRLDAHLTGCASCRSTQAAFSDQRQIMAGLRHVAPPRDLSARVRAGIEAGAHPTQPWWKRPPAIFAGIGGGLAVVAGALLAIVLLGEPSNDPEVGQPSPTPATSISASATADSAATPAPIATATASDPPPTATAPPPSASAEPPPTATPVESSPEPDAYVAVTGELDNQLLTIRDGPTSETIMEAEAPSGPPIAAELSPDGQWVAYVNERGLSGHVEVSALRISEPPEVSAPEAPEPVDSSVPVGETLPLGTGIAGSPFVEHLSWSPDGRYLAFTLIDLEGGGADAWIFDAADGETSRLTDVGNAYAGTWVPDDAAGLLLWVSTAGETPRSHLLMVDDSGNIEAGDPADGSFLPAENVFQPLLSPNGALVIYWNGRMERAGDDWTFVEGGTPWIAENVGDGGAGYEFENSQQLFTDLTVGRNGFTSAAISWALDSDAFAVWDAQWTGVSQGSGGEYPDQRRVYLGRATDARHITQIHALDAGDVPEDSSVVDVKVAGTGRHLAITARRPVPGDLATPQADLLLVTRNTGNTADEVVDFDARDEGWYGPALFNNEEWERLTAP
ncbi:MAG TPA: zf-HC2 domain-containing protein [Candidatus Limnocylindria bacterium]|nr:zf-HC2 domain-containing protein [Candidatus Limnocylindria bacterium]